MTSLLEKVFYFLSPHDCFLCGNEGNVVCVACRNELIDERLCQCHVCGAPSADYQPCPGCRRKTALSGLYVLGGHQGEVRDVVSRLKFAGARQVAADLAPVLASLLPVLPEDAVMTHLPTANLRVRQRGFDQAELLAKALAMETKRPHQTIFVRRGHTRQVGANEHERRQQAAGMFRLRRASAADTILLVDDVITTGASMETAATLLRRAGVRQVYGVAVAR